MIKEIESLEKTRDEHLKRGLELQKYAEEVEKNNAKLEKEKQKNIILEKRLTPEYKKIFGRFANLKDNENI